MKLRELFGICLCLKFLDFVLTYYLVRDYGGIESELNPFVRWLMYQVGLAWAITMVWIFSIFTIGTAYWYSKLIKSKWIFYVLNIIFSLVCLNNIIQFFLVTH